MGGLIEFLVSSCILLRLEKLDTPAGNQIEGITAIALAKQCFPGTQQLPLKRAFEF
jgi:hypothetical protein